MYNTTTYRPTNEGCLMRMVGTSRFCPVCQEGLWGSLLKRVRLIDEVAVDSSFFRHFFFLCSRSGSPHPHRLGRATDQTFLSKPVLADTYQVSLSLPSLADLRPPTSPFGSAESYTISWSRNLLSLPHLANQTDFALAKEDGKGEWRVEVTFESGEIRNKADWTSDAFAFTIV